jgi:hypothetical protein
MGLTFSNWRARGTDGYARRQAGRQAGNLKKEGDAIETAALPIEAGCTSPPSARLQAKVLASLSRT